VNRFFSSNNVSVIHRPGNTVVATIPVGRSPSGVAFTPDGTQAYVTNAADSTVSVINTATNQVAGLPIPVGGYPVRVAVNPNGTQAYVTNEFSNTVSVIKTASPRSVLGFRCADPCGRRRLVRRSGFFPSAALWLADCLGRRCQVLRFGVTIHPTADQADGRIHAKPILGGLQHQYARI
jgi:YVTN family beta-propeller protein